MRSFVMILATAIGATALSPASASTIYDSFYLPPADPGFRNSWEIVVHNAVLTDAWLEIDRWDVASWYEPAPPGWGQAAPGQEWDHEYRLSGNDSGWYHYTYSGADDSDEGRFVRDTYIREFELEPMWLRFTQENSRMVEDSCTLGDAPGITDDVREALFPGRSAMDFLDCGLTSDTGFELWLGFEGLGLIAPEIERTLVSRISVAPIPLPASGQMMLMAALGLGLAGRMARKKRR